MTGKQIGTAISYLTLLGSVLAMGVWNNTEIGKVNEKIFAMQQRVSTVEGQLMRISTEGVPVRKFGEKAPLPQGKLEMAPKWEPPPKAIP